MKLLVIGANGQLGWELCRQGKIHNFDIIPLDLPDFDIISSENVNKVIKKYRPALIINASAYTAVDQAEEEPKIAFAVNRQGASNLAEACNIATIPLIHISTDYVFDGGKKGPYLETDPVSPIGIYGKSKAKGEREIREKLTEHIIVRTAWLYGVHGNNFVKTMLRMGRERDEIRVVSDQYGCPTFAADLARAVLIIAGKVLGEKSVSWGTYHFCGKGRTTWFEFTKKIFELAARYNTLRVKTVVPIPTSEYATLARRPENSEMDCSLLLREFGIKQPHWERSLASMLERFYRQLDECQK